MPPYGSDGRVWVEHKAKSTQGVGQRTPTHAMLTPCQRIYGLSFIFNLIYKTFKAEMLLEVHCALCHRNS